MPTLYFNSNGANIKWSDPANFWTDPSHTIAAGAIPTGADPVILNAAAGDCDWDSGTVTMLSLDCTGYTGTMSISVAASACNGSFTLGAGMTITSTSANNTITLDGDPTITLAGLTFPASFAFKDAATNGTITLAEDQTWSGDCKPLGNRTRTFAGNRTLTARGWISEATSASEIITGMTLNLTTSWSQVNGTTGGFGNGTINIDAGVGSPFTVTGSVGIGNSALNYVSGAVDASAATLRLRGTTTNTIDTYGIEWGSLLNQGSSLSRTQTLASRLDVIGVFTLNSTTAVQTHNGSAIYCGGLALPDVTSGGTDGTSEIHVEGGNISMNANVTTGKIANPLHIEGDVNFASRVQVKSTVTYVSGTPTFAAGAAIVVMGDMSLDLDGMDANIEVKEGLASIPLVILLSPLTGETLTMNKGTAWWGDYGWSFANVIAAAGTSQYLRVGKEYVVTNSLTLADLTIQSSTAEVSTKLTLQAGASQSVSGVTAIDIDSDDGQKIIDPGGTLTRTVNWVLSAESDSGEGGWGGAPWGGAKQWGGIPWGGTPWGA